MYNLTTTINPPYQHRILRSGVNDAIVGYAVVDEATVDSDEEVKLETRSASVTRPAGAGEGLSIGDAPAAQLTLTAGPGLKEGEEIVYQVGDGTSWVPIGVFTILTAQGNDGVYTYTGADAMAVQMETLWLAEDCATAFEVLESVAAQCGLTLVTDGLTDVTLPRSPTAGPTCRELAGQMAALFGGNAVIDRLGRLTVLVWQLDSAALAVTADETYAGETELGAQSHSIQSVSCTVETETASTDEDGLTTTETASETLSAGTPGAPGISIANPYMTQAQVDAICQALQGKAYYSGSVGYIGHPELDPGDLIRVTDREGNSYLVPIMQLDWTLDGGLRSTAQAFAQSEAENQGDYSGPTTQAMERMTADLASFKTLYAQNLRAQRGWFKSLITDDLTAVTINASKYITGVTILGDLIQANTLSAKKIILEGADGLFYELNAKAGTLTAEQLTDEQYQQRLDGSVLVANSITADKINVTDLFAQDITATGTIRGVTLEGAKGTIADWDIINTGLGKTAIKTDTNGATMTYQYVFQAPSDANGCSDVLYARHRAAESDNWIFDFLLKYDGTVATRSSVSANTFVADNHTGYYAKNTGGTNVAIARLDNTNQQIFGNNGYPTLIGGSTITSSKTISVSSDRRVKDDIASLDKPYLGLLDELRPVRYRYKDQPEREHVGLIAQDVQSALATAGISDSALVTEDSNGMLGISYTELIGLLVREVQTLKARVKALEDGG